MAVHQCARFQDSPKQPHIQAVWMIGWYLIGTKDKGIIPRPDQVRSFECWVDTDIVGNWLPEGAQKDPMMSKSQSGWVITYAGCSVTWVSKLQTLTELSTTEVEYVSLSCTS